MDAISGSRIIFNNNNDQQTNVSGFDLESGTYSNDGITHIAASISSVGYATFSSTKNVDFSGVANLTAKKGKVQNNGKIHWTTASTLKAGEGVLLEGNQGTYEIPIINSASTDTENNDFVAIDTKQSIAQTIDSKTNYILTNKKSDGTIGELGFYMVNASGSWCAAGTAYLSTTYSPSAARGYFPVWDETSSVEGIVNEYENNNVPVFDLQGRRVNNPQKGLYIVNGKKFIR